MSAALATPVALAVALGTLLFNVLALRFLPPQQVSVFVAFFALANAFGFFFSSFQIPMIKAISLSPPSDRRHKLDTLSKQLLALAGAIAAALLGSSSVWNSWVGFSPTLLILVSLIPIWIVILSIVGNRLNASGKFALAGTLGLLNISLNLFIQVAFFGLLEIEVQVTTVLLLHATVNLLVGAVALASVKSAVMTSSLVTVANAKIALTAMAYGLLLQLDLLIVGLVLSGNDRADYAAAAGLAKSILLIAGIFYLAVVRALIHRASQKISSQDFLKRAIFGAGLTALTFWAGASILGPRLMVFLYGDQWAVASHLLPLLGMAVAPYIVVGVLVQPVLVNPRWGSLAFLSTFGIAFVVGSLVVVTTPTHLALAWMAVGILLAAYLVLSQARRATRS